MNGMGLPVLTALFLAAVPAPLYANSAQEPSVSDIMEKNFFVTKVRSAQIDSTMILINDKGQTRERKSRTIAQLKKNGIESKLLVKFNSPADIKGTGFLQLEHTEGDDDLWANLAHVPCDLECHLLQRSAAVGPVAVQVEIAT